MTTVYLIRHAEAEGNLYRRIQGQYDVNVTPNGFRQIAALEERFRDVSVDACWSSNLIRTRMTAQAICRTKNLPLQLDDGLLEVGLGRWENVPFGKLYTCEPDLMKTFDHDPVNWQVEGCERYTEYTSRFLQTLNRITDQYPDATVCLFSHGAVIRAAMKCLFPDAKIGHSDNTAVTMLTKDADGYHGIYFNDTSHLTDDISTLAKQNWWRNDGSRDYNLWFRTDVPIPASISAPERTEAHVAFLDHVPVGAVFLAGKDSIGYVVHMEVLPQWRGLDLEEQLLGQAMFTFREEGKTTLCVQPSASVDKFCSAHGLCHDGDFWSMDIRLMKC